MVSATRRLTSIEDAADYVGTSAKTIRRRITAGELRGYRFGARLIRVDLDEVDQLLREIPAAGGPDAA